MYGRRPPPRRSSQDSGYNTPSPAAQVMNEVKEKQEVRCSDDDFLAFLCYNFPANLGAYNVPTFLSFHNFSFASCVHFIYLLSTYLHLLLVCRLYSFPLLSYLSSSIVLTCSNSLSLSIFYFFFSTPYFQVSSYLYVLYLFRFI